MSDLSLVGAVTAVCMGETHGFSKPLRDSITLIAGLGVAGDAHAGKTVKHRSRVAVDPSQPNLRQVHLIHGELHDDLIAKGFKVGPGVMGENITTRGIDLLALPQGTLLALGSDAVVAVTGLRNPCRQLEDYQRGLAKALVEKTPAGEVILKSGVMGIVLAGGIVRAGAPIEVTLPAPPHLKLERV